MTLDDATLRLKAEQTVEREWRITSVLKATVTGRRHVNRNVRQHRRRNWSQPPSPDVYTTQRKKGWGRCSN